MPGNHDEALREYVDMHLGGVAVKREVIHQTAGGRSLLIIHGDEYDGVMAYAKWLALLGDHAYSFALALNN